MSSAPRVRLSSAALFLLIAAACTRADDESLRRAVPADEDRYVRTQLQALARGDSLALLRDLDPALNDSLTHQAIAQMTREIAGRRIDRMDVIGYQSSDSAGIPIRAIQYQLRLDDGWAVGHLTSRTQEGRRILEGASLSRVPEPLQETHGFGVAGKPPLHYLFLALMLAVPALMAAAIVLVFRMPLRFRPLWVLGSLVGLGAWRLNWTEGTTYFSPVTLQILGSGFFRDSVYSPWIFVVSLPVGALFVLQRYWEWSREASGPPPTARRRRR